MSNIKRYFVAGILVTLPVFLTVYLLFVIFRFIDGIWGKVINYYLKKNFGFSIPGIGFILGVLTVLIIGFVATKITNKRFFKAIEDWFLKLPVINQIYPAARQIVRSLFSRESQAFKKVVLVEYPSRGLWAIGFITNESFKEANEKAASELVHVFIATTPSPLTGYLALIPKKDVKYLDISVEEGIKLIVSGGIVKPQ